MSETPHTPVWQCSKCPNSYPATSEFFPVSQGKLEKRCRECKKASQRKSYATHRNEVRSSQKVYREANRERINEQKRQSFYAHREEDNARRRAHRLAHLEQEKTTSKLYREKNKESVRERSKLYRETHKEEVAERKRRYQQTSEHHKAYQKRYHQEHKERISVLSRENYLAQREGKIARQRHYLRTEKGRMVDRAHRWKRKAQKRASQGSYSSQQLQEQMQRQKSRCYYCREKLEALYHVEHIVPLSKGGSNDIHNIVLACADCNMSKGAKLLHEWPQGNRLL